MSSQPPADPRGRDGAVDGTSADDDLHESLADGLDYGLPTEAREGPSWGLILGALLVMAAVGFIVFDGMQSETYFFDAHEAVERSDDLVGETIRIRGNVQPGTVEGGQGQLESRFDVTTQGKSLQIIYRRALPDTFEEDSEVVVQGRLKEGLVLEASEVLVKCPSRYEGGGPDHSEENDYSDYRETEPRASDNATKSDDPQALR